jgi:hypothetical protein
LSFKGSLAGISIQQRDPKGGGIHVLFSSDMTGNIKGRTADVVKGGQDEGDKICENQRKNESFSKAYQFVLTHPCL